MTKFHWEDLWGGGAYRWLIRATVLGSLALLLILYKVFAVHILIAILISSLILFIGLGATYALLSSGRIKIKL